MRIYNKKINLKKESVKNFFDGRGERIALEPLTAVLYQDKNPALAHKRDEYERGKVFPLLSLKRSSKVLDIGCGIGRWASLVAPEVESYVGIDFSSPFIEYAEKEYQDYKNVSFKVLDALLISPSRLGGSNFDRIIIAGLLLYLNDKDVKLFISKLKKVLKKGALIYLREPIGVKERLSLRNVWSEDLNQSYSAIYRTREELVELLGEIDIIQEGDMYEADLNNRPETKQYFFIFRYKDE